MSKKVYCLQSEDEDKEIFHICTRDKTAFKNMKKDLKEVALKHRTTIKMCGGDAADTAFRHGMHNAFFKEQDTVIEYYEKYLL